MAGKVAELNLEQGNPTVAEALRRLKNELMTLKGRGVRVVILIHGYGSSGAGGSIRPAVRAALRDGTFRGLVRDSVPGETWHTRKKELLTACRDLEAYERRVSGNEGVTLVLLK